MKLINQIKMAEDAGFSNLRQFRAFLTMAQSSPVLFADLALQLGIPKGSLSRCMSDSISPDFMDRVTTVGANDKAVLQLSVTNAGRTFIKKLCGLG